MTDKNDKINKAVWKAINKTINKFRKHPDYFFTESDIHSYFYYALYLSDHKELNLNAHEKDIYCVHREYPTNFRYKKKELLDDAISKPHDLIKKLGSRGHYDMAILDPEFIKNANSMQDIINKSVKLLEIRTKDNKYFVNSKELLFAIEFKYIINNSKNFIYEIKMDNKKLLFAKDYGGTYEAVNLIFCKVDFKYEKDLMNLIGKASDKILSVFIQSRGKPSRSIKMNKEESRIKHGESLKISTK